MRWKRRRLLLRAFRKRRQLTVIADRTSNITSGDILVFATMRNEIARLPFFLDYYRKIGVRHFLIVDNDSTDGTRAYLEGQADVSLWTTAHSYKLSRFGVDWLTWLMMRHGHGHWCLTLDADEILVFPGLEGGDLVSLTGRLQADGQDAFGALLLDMYPKERLSTAKTAPGDDPFETLCWFDPAPYRATYQKKHQSLWIQGGVRERVFFRSRPERAPTLNKVPLVRWNRRYVYVSSTHSLLPPRLNHVFGATFGGLGRRQPSGALLHSKFLDLVVDKSAEEKDRREHFANSDLYEEYYDGLIADPILWHEGSVRYSGWRQLVELGLMADTASASGTGPAAI